MVPWQAAQEQCADKCLRPRQSRLLSCPKAVGGVVLADRARTFAKMRSDKNATEHHGSRSRACLLHWVCRVFAHRACVMFARATEAGTQEMRPLCSLFCRSNAEGDEQTGPLGRGNVVRYCGLRTRERTWQDRRGLPLSDISNSNAKCRSTWVDFWSDFRQRGYLATGASRQHARCNRESTIGRLLKSLLRGVAYPRAMIACDEGKFNLHGRGRVSAMIDRLAPIET